MSGGPCKLSILHMRAAIRNYVILLFSFLYLVVTMFIAQKAITLNASRVEDTVRYRERSVKMSWPSRHIGAVRGLV